MAVPAFPQVNLSSKLESELFQTLRSVCGPFQLIRAITLPLPLHNNPGGIYQNECKSLHLVQRVQKMTQLSFYIVSVSEATIYSYHFQTWIWSLLSCTCCLPGLQMETMGIQALLPAPATILGSQESCQPWHAECPLFRKSSLALCSEFSAGPGEALCL